MVLVFLGAWSQFSTAISMLIGRMLVFEREVLSC